MPSGNGKLIVPGMKTLQERLAWARSRAGRSQEEVAEFIGIKQSSYSDLERGKTQRSKYTAEIAHFLGVNAYWLATGEGDPDPAPHSEVAALFSQLTEEDQRALIRSAQGLLASSSRNEDR